MREIAFISPLIYFLPLALISGPFLSDLIISISSIYFVYVCVKYNEWGFIKNRLFLILTSFYIYILILSFLSNNPYLSLESSLFYVRFILFIFLFKYIIKYNDNFSSNFLFSIILTFSFLSIDALVQFVLGYNLLGYSGEVNRISGLFGDEYILGNYLSRLIPLLCALYFLQNNISSEYKLLFFISILFSLFAILISGERVAVSNILIFISVFLIFSKINMKFKLICFAAVSSLFLSLIIFSNQFNERVINLTYSQLGLDPLKKNYFFSWKHQIYYETGLDLFIEKPIFGHGPKMYRHECQKFDDYQLRCSTHPHNIYVQLLAETGIIGFTLVLSLFFWTIYKIISNYFLITKSKINPIIYNFELCLLCTFMINLFPMIPSFNFFNNWVSIVFYLPLGFYLGKKYIIKKYSF